MARRGGHHTAKIVLVSVDFAEIEALQHDGRWDEAGARMAAAARQVAAGGDALLVVGGRALRWSPGGYREAAGAVFADRLITPPSSVAALAAGYRPALHPSAAP